jgi:hypothetical protein
MALTVVLVLAAAMMARFGGGWSGRRESIVAGAVVASALCGLLALGGLA